MIDRSQIDSLRGGTLLDRDGDKVGNIDEIYMDRETNQPEWALVSGGLFSSSKFVPLKSARVEGNDLWVNYDKDQIKDAPKFAADGELSQEEEGQLYRHYGLEYSEYSDTSTDRDSGDAMTRSEEELSVDKSTQERGVGRLKKYVTTENVQTAVPVQREEVRVEREPITEANRDEALSGSAITEDEHEVTLKEEVPTVEKKVVPKERVRLGKETVTEEHQVSDEVRKEQIEAEGDVSNR